MQEPIDPGPHERGECGELRLRAETVCATVPDLRAAAAQASDQLTRARSALYAAESQLTAAQDAADPKVIAAAKAQAQRTYRRAYGSAVASDDRKRAATTWLRELDRMNRGARSARSAIERARRAVASAQRGLDPATLTSDAARIRAETAADACRTARARLAECEEREVTFESNGTATAAPSNGRSAEGDAPRPDRPLIIERLLDGDRMALRLLSHQLAEATGRDATTFMLLLQELVEAIGATAAAAGFVTFEDKDPFWSQFAPYEARAIVQALAGMGFRFDPGEGWVGGRMPGQGEMSIALGQVGYDVRSVRMPMAGAMAGLFDTAHVAVDEQLAQRAPHLALDQMQTLLGPRADALGELWDDWGRLRPLLLAESPR